MRLAKTFTILEYQDYCIHYLQPVPKQVQNQQSFLPSLISYNEKALHTQSINILDRINWLNKVHNEKVTDVNASSEVTEINRITIKETMPTTKVSFLKVTSVSVSIHYL